MWLSTVPFTHPLSYSVKCTHCPSYTPHPSPLLCLCLHSSLLLKFLLTISAHPNTVCSLKTNSKDISSRKPSLISPGGADISCLSISGPLYLCITYGMGHYLSKIVDINLSDSVHCTWHDTLKLQKWGPMSNAKDGSLREWWFCWGKLFLNLLPTPSLPPTASCRPPHISEVGRAGIKTWKIFL